MAPYQQEGERARLEQRLSQEAIALAIQGKWEEAVVVNKNIIERFPTDVEAYNRLGRALTELGDFARAKEAYTKALELAPDNAIAKKNLARLASLCESEVGLDDEHRQASPFKGSFHRIAPELFITEMGKAGIVNLCNLAPSEVLAKVSLGDEVELRVVGQHLIVEGENGEYLGEVERKHELRLINLIKGGNSYTAAILNVSLPDEVQVVIKETYQHPSQVGRLSFPVKAAERLRLPTEESLVRRSVIDEGEAIEEIEYSEEEAKYSKGEDESLPEGFSLVEEIDKKGEIEE